MNFSTSATAALVSAQLAKPQNLLIIYLGYRLFPAPLNAPYNVLLPGDRITKDIWTFVLLSIVFFILVALFFRARSRQKEARARSDMAERDEHESLM